MAQEPPAARQALWTTAYYPGWTAESLPPREIAFQNITHLVHFSVKPQPDGTLDWKTHELTDAHIAATVAAAHAAGKPVVLCVGGANTGAGFRAALQPAVRAALIRQLAAAVQSHGYDGLDVDMEPMEGADAALFVPFIRDLGAELRARNPRWLLTAAVGALPAMFAGLQDQFDQINLMAYDLSGPWEDWVTWHNAALHNSTLKFPTVNRLLPSVEGSLREWLAAGIAPGKLGLGMPFYGYVWRGASEPQQSAKGTSYRNTSYRDIVTIWEQSGRQHWDEVAAVPYLRIDAKGGELSSFVSYDDERSLRLKVACLRELHLGGAMIWELDSGHFPKRPSGQRDPLLAVVYEAMMVK